MRFQKNVLSITGIITFLLISFQAFPVDIYVNDQLVTTVSDGELTGRSYTVTIDGQARQGVALLEVVPLMSDAYKMDVDSARGRRTWTDTGYRSDGFLDRFCCWYVISNDGTWDLFAGNEELQEVTRISLYGEPIKDRKLTVWLSWEGVDELKEEIARFARIHDVRIKTVDVPKTESKLISILRGGGELPDVLMIQSDYLPSLTRAGAIQNLDYIIDGSPLTEELRDTGIRAFTLRDNVWAVPFYFDSQLVFYNTNVVSSVLDSWDLWQFEDVLTSIKNQGIAPITWNAYSAYWLVPFQIGFGKEALVQQDGSIVINDKPTHDALAYIMELKERGLLEVMERDGMISLFTSGRIGMILTGSYSIPHFEKLGIPFDVAPYPYNPETGSYISPLLDYKAFAITKKTKHPILARRLIEYLASVGVQQRFPPAMSKLPANTAAWEIKGPENPYYQALQKSAEIGTLVPAERAYGIYKNTMWKLIRFIITGQMSIEETLERGQKLIDSKLELQQ
jgi:maltose-binding protein MalE